MTGLLVIGVIMFVSMLFIGVAIADDERKRVDRIYSNARKARGEE